MEKNDARITNNPGKGKKNSHESTVRKSPTEAQLCQNRHYEECPSSAITDTVYTAGVTGMDFWEVNQNSLNGGKNFSAGRVELQIRDRFDLTDFAEITYQTKEVIAQQFGEQTLKLHYALAAIAFRQPEIWKEEMTISVSKLLADFGEDKKRNHYIPKTERDGDSKPTRYFSKEEKLLQLAHHAYLLKRLEVWVQQWRVRHKRIFTVEMSNLWDIKTIKKVVQKSLDGNDTLIDIEITYSPGSWFEKFAGNEYLREFGYITSEALKLDPYQEKMALRLAYFALFALQQHKNGRYQIETLLRRIGYTKEIEDGKIERNVAANLKRSFDRGLKTLGRFEYPYTFNYDPNAPEWVDPGSNINKPRNWFDRWLQCQGTLHHPEILDKHKPKPSPSKTQTSKEQPAEIPALNPDSNTKSLAFGQRIKKARQATGESLRFVAKQLEISPSRLSQIENDRYPHPLEPDFKTQLLAYLNLGE